MERTPFESPHSVGTSTPPKSILIFVIILLTPLSVFILVSCEEQALRVQACFRWWRRWPLGPLARWWIFVEAARGGLAWRWHSSFCLLDGFCVRHIWLLGDWRPCRLGGDGSGCDWSWGHRTSTIIPNSHQCEVALHAMLVVAQLHWPGRNRVARGDAGFKSLGVRDNSFEVSDTYPDM